MGTDKGYMMDDGEPARPWKSPLAQSVFAKALMETGKQTEDGELTQMGRENLEASQRTYHLNFPANPPSPEPQRKPTKKWIGPRLGRALDIIFVCICAVYFIGFYCFGTVFEYQQSKATDLPSWLLFTDTTPTLKAMIWPYFVFFK